MSSASPAPTIQGPKITRRGLLSRAGTAAALALSGCRAETPEEEQARILRDDFKLGPNDLPAILYMAYGGCGDSGIHNFDNIENIVRRAKEILPNLRTFHLDMYSLGPGIGTSVAPGIGARGERLLENSLDPESMIPGEHITATWIGHEDVEVSADRLIRLGFFVNASNPTAHGSQMIVVGANHEILAVGDSKEPQATIETFRSALSPLRQQEPSP